jgi:uncharacterized protein
MLPRVIFIVLTLLVTGNLGFLIGPASASDRIALVLGNSKYQSVPKLDNPSNDAADFAAKLREIGFDVIEQRDATRDGMANAVRAFADRIQSAKVALFFYAGHGLQMAGENYLLPVDAKVEKEADVRFNAISLNDIQQEMEGPGRANIIVLDACRDNPFAEKLAHSGRGIASRGLGRMDASGVGSLVVFSTQPNNIALDGSGRNSPFMSALLKRVDTPGLEVRQMISRVRGDVLAATDQKQVPWDNSSLVGDVYLTGQPGSPPPAAAPPEVKMPEAKIPEAKVPEAKIPGFGTIAPAGDTVASRDSDPAPVEPRSDCDRLAALRVPYSSPQAVHEAELVDWPKAAAACEAELQAHPGEVRFEYQLGRSQVMLKSYSEGLRHLRSAAAGGFAEAMNDVGRAYYFGQGVVQSYPTALDWFNKAADAGSMRAVASLASMYGDGRGVARNDVKSLDLAEKAVEGGNPFGLLIIANHYFNGFGVAKDYQMAAQYFQQAADLGDGKSMKFLANMYEAGYLGPPNPQKADALRIRAQQVDPESPNPEPYRFPPYKAGAAAHSGGGGPHRRYIVYRRVLRFGYCVYVCW